MSGLYRLLRAPKLPVRKTEKMIWISNQRLKAKPGNRKHFLAPYSFSWLFLFSFVRLFWLIALSPAFCCFPPLLWPCSFFLVSLSRYSLERRFIPCETTIKIFKHTLGWGSLYRLSSSRHSAREKRYHACIHLRLLPHNPSRVIPG